MNSLTIDTGDSTNPLKVFFLETKSSAIENQILSENFNKKVQIEYKKIEQLNDNIKCDLLIALDIEANSSIQKNRDLLLKLNRIAKNIVFSSPVPCFAKNKYAFWPSYWIQLGNEIGLTSSMDLRNQYWFDNLFTCSQLEGLIFFKKKDELFEFTNREITDLYHPLHGCGHFRTSDIFIVKISQLLPIKLKIFIRKLLKENLIAAFKNRYIRLPKQINLKSQNQAPALNVFGYHPAHQCRHYDSHTKINRRIKTFILRHLSYKRRQILKRVFPNKFIAKIKGFLLK